MTQQWGYRNENSKEVKIDTLQLFGLTSLHAKTRRNLWY